MQLCTCDFTVIVFSVIREFIESELIDFARNNPGVVVYVKPRRHRGPTLTAEYCEFFFYFFGIINDRAFCKKKKKILIIYPNEIMYIQNFIRICGFLTFSSNFYGCYLRTLFKSCLKIKIFQNISDCLFYC